MENQKASPGNNTDQNSTESIGEYHLTRQIENERAVAFIYQYATEHPYFTGGDVLEAYRASEEYLEPTGGWRNRWAALISKCAKKSWYVKAGRVAPTTKQSHTSTLTQWQSRLYRGPMPVVGRSTREQLIELLKKVRTRELDIMQALWAAHAIGTEQSTREN